MENMKKMMKTDPFRYEETLFDRSDRIITIIKLECIFIYTYTNTTCSYLYVYPYIYEMYLVRKGRIWTYSTYFLFSPHHFINKIRVYPFCSFVNFPFVLLFFNQFFFLIFFFSIFIYIFFYYYFYPFVFLHKFFLFLFIQ